MQAEAAQLPVVLENLLSFPSDSLTISASFEVTQINPSPSSPTIVLRQLDSFDNVGLQTDDGHNSMLVTSSSIGKGTVGFNLVLSISENLGWTFANPAGVFPVGSSSPSTAGLLINPVSPTALSVGFMVSPSQSGEANFTFSLTFTNASTNQTITIDDPTVILKPPT